MMKRDGCLHCQHSGVFLKKCTGSEVGNAQPEESEISALPKSHAEKNSSKKFIYMKRSSFRPPVICRVKTAEALPLYHTRMSIIDHLQILKILLYK